MIEQYLPGFEKHLKVLAGLSEITAKAYSSKISEFEVWLNYEDRYEGEVDGLDRKHIERFLEWCFYQGNNNQTRHTKLTALGKFFRYLRYEQVVAEDITAEIPKPKLEKRMMQFFSKDETLRMFRQIAIVTQKGIRDVCILLCAAFCGLRISEIYGMNIEDVLDDGKDIDLNILDTKHGRNRVVYLWKAPALFVRQWLSIRLAQGAKGRDPLFISFNRGGKSKGRRLNAGAIDDLIKGLAEKAGVRRHAIKSHMFRTMHANDLQSVKGYTLPAIMERLGWEDLSTAGRYLVRRERIHRIYNSLHEYWIEFPKLWNKEEVKIDNNNGGIDDAKV